MHHEVLFYNLESKWSFIENFLAKHSLHIYVILLPYCNSSFCHRNLGFCFRILLFPSTHLKKGPFHLKLVLKISIVIINHSLKHYVQVNSSMWSVPHCKDHNEEDKTFIYLFVEIRDTLFSFTHVVTAV